MIDAPVIVHALGAIATLVCAILLLRGYRRSGVRLLLWGGLCFACFALNNALLIVDHVVGRAIDLSVIRTIPALIGLALMIYGLVWETRR